MRIGKHTDKDIEEIKKRIIHDKNSDEVKDIPHFFPTRDKVDEYNNEILETKQVNILQVKAIDITPNDISEGFRKQLLQIIHKRKKESTGGLEKIVHIALNHQYDLMTNIDVEDGLINEAECCVKYITENKNN